MIFSNEMKAYVAEKLPTMNDYSFIDKVDFSAIVDELMESESVYIEGLAADENGELDYDDDAAFDYILGRINAKFPSYKMYCMAIVEDYMEVSEAYMTEHGEIDWD